jgi:hypothetical protein
MSEMLHVAYAIGALAGLRTGEVFAVRWEQIDLARRRIHVRESVKGPLKDNNSRVVPILDRLLPVLQGWKLRTGGKGRVIPALRSDGGKIDRHTLGICLREALNHRGLTRPGVRTERYAHLRPGLFSSKDLATADIDLNAGEAERVPIRPENGLKMARPRPISGRIILKSRQKCRSRPVSRVPITVGMGRFPGRPGATSGRKPWSECDWRRRGVTPRRHRKAG